jgi:hypothetical protein
VRAPHSLDLAATVAAGPDAGLATILQRCITVLDGDPLPAIDDALVAEVSQRIAALDPVAEILIQLQCPDCDAAWSESLDVVEQIWAGVQARARRLLREVDVLARAYGWSERQILSLSHARRQAYLEICQG